MKNKTYMLPYKYRKCGYGMVITSVLAIVLGILMANVLEVIPEACISYISMVLYILFFLGIFFIVMAEEKDEDEMIAAIRHKSITLTAFIAFGLFILINLIGAVDHGFNSLNTWVVAFTALGVTNVFTFIIIYLAIFRISLRKMRRQCKEDEA